MAPVRVYEVHTLAQLARQADAWDALAVGAPERLPMLSYAWVSSYLEHRLQPGQRWRCLFAYAADDLVGVLPVVQVRRVLPGVRLHGTVDAHTRSGYALLGADRPVEALSAMLGQLADLEPRYLWLRFSGIRSGSSTLPTGRLATASCVEMPAARGSGSVVDTRGSLDEFDAGLSTNFRRNLRKARNRSQREHQASWRFHRGEQARPIELLQRFLDLEAAGWKGEAGTAIGCSTELVDFYATLTRRLSDRGWLEWQFLDLDGAPAAGHLAVRFGGSLSLVKIAYDESFSRLGPGNLLFHQTVARAFADEGVDEINCVTDMAWHENWHMSKAAYSDMVVSPRRLLPTAAGAVELAVPGALARRARGIPWMVTVVRKAKAARGR